MQTDKFVKPKIEIDGYSVEWTDLADGVPESEVSEFKTFIRDAIPYLGAVHHSAEYLQRQIEQTKNLERGEVGQFVFSPVIQLRHGTRSEHGRTEYILSMTWDGAIFIERELDLGENKTTYYLADLDRLE